MTDLLVVVTAVCAANLLSLGLYCLSRRVRQWIAIWRYRRWEKKNPPKPVDPKSTLASLSHIYKQHYSAMSIAEGGDFKFRDADPAMNIACVDQSLDETLVTIQGGLTAQGRRRARELVAHIEHLLAGHDDNTGMSCRVDLRGHDCCYICNDVGDALLAIDAQEHTA